MLLISLNMFYPNKEIVPGVMIFWLEWLLVKQEDLGSIQAQTKCFSSQ